MHYLYMYLDPRKPGRFSYLNKISLLFEPIYVGKSAVASRKWVTLENGQQKFVTPKKLAN
jgi:hypothetical protein